MSESVTDSLPLLSRRDDHPFAFILTPTPSLTGQPSLISVGRFYHHVLGVAEQLPERGFAINLCENRYLFCVAFCAALVRRHTNLLPPNRAPQTLGALEHRHQCYYLVDGQAPDTEAPVIDLATNALADGERAGGKIGVASEHVAAVCYTSGSTGESKPIHKTWGQFFRANTLNGERMAAGLDRPIYQLATVPPQHMWGLETSVLLPLHHAITLCDARPLYPADIVAQLNQLPAPRLLVSTPIHLRALIAADTDLPPLQRILCATSPLGQQLAAEVEQKSGGQLLEIYGCSELGSMAARATSTTDIWTLFPGFELERDDEGTCARARHMGDATRLGDHLELLDDRRFRLAGRTADLVNIAGKRGSLAEINRVLLEFEGIDDGVVFQPSLTSSRRRLAALVVMRPGVEKTELVSHFRDRIDAAFIPRPIVSVAQLPRAESGKLPRDAVLALYESLRRGASESRKSKEQH